MAKGLNILQREKRKFVLSIGDEGAILICVNGKKLVKRLFVTSPSSPEFLSMLEEAPKAPLYVFVDIVDQAYVQHSLPPVSALNISKLVKRKMDKEFDPNDIKASISLGREKAGRRDWNYMFVSLKNSPPFSDWIEVVSELENKFSGIFLLPLEGMNYLKDLRKHVFVDKGHKEAEWQIIVSHNRVGGFRQIVFKKNNMIFTRIAQPIGGQTPDVVAGNIEQETLNTIEYIRRLGFEDVDGLDLYIIASADVKESLETNSLPCEAPLIITPHEIASQMGFENCADRKDRFGDVVIATHFATTKKHILKLNTDYTEKVSKIRMINSAVRAAAVVASLFVLFTAFQGVIKIFSLKSEIASIEIDATASKNVRSGLDKFKAEYEKDPSRIKKLANLDRKLSKDNLFPLDFVSKYAKLDEFNSYVETITLVIDEEIKNPNEIEASFDVKLFSSDPSNPDQLLDDVDLFTEDVKLEFRDYDVTFSGLLDDKEISLELADSGVGGSEKQELSLKINITGAEVK